MSYSLAIDIGGTFTDAVLRADNGDLFVDKTLTTHQNLLEGFFRGVGLVLAKSGASPEQVDGVVVHATTVVTNALIERKGPPTALITTKGFRDVLSIRNEHRYDMYDPQIEFAEPLIPAALTFEVDERTLADGQMQHQQRKQRIHRKIRQPRRKSHEQQRDRRYADRPRRGQAPHRAPGGKPVNQQPQRKPTDAPQQRADLAAVIRIPHAGVKRAVMHIHERRQRDHGRGRDRAGGRRARSREQRDLHQHREQQVGTPLRADGPSLSDDAGCHTPGLNEQQIGPEIARQIG